MTSTLAEAAEAPVAGAREAAARRLSVARGYRFELVKLLSQWRIRVLILACWIVPAIFVAAVSQQSSLPADTLFGRWMHASGWAGSLVMLGFSGSWALPLLTSVVAGDVFSSEDRLGTWRHLLVAVRSPRRIFVTKALASLSIVLLLVTGLAVSSIGAGLAAIGDHPLVGIDGHLLAPADATGKVVLAWVCVLAPTLALAALGLIGSIALGRSPIGLLVPALVALAMQLAQMLPLPVAVRIALPGYAFIAWGGLFSSPIQLAPLLISIAVSLAWAVVATALAYLLFLRRDFTNVTHDKSARRAVTAALLPLAALLAVTVLVLDLSTGATASGIGNSTVAPVPVPVKIGDPSVIKHVFVLVKENRTYDQVFGDKPQGNGDPAFAQFGDNVTPNQHALASQFGLYDNFYEVGTNSAEGHNWVMQGDNPEYTESSAGEYTRSYDTENDVLGHQSSGFIWTGAQAAGKIVKDFGKFQSMENKPAGATWQNLYCDSKNMAATGAPTAYPITTGSAIPSLNAVSVQGFPLFDLNVPDIYKEQIWQQDFAKNGPANLNMFWFSNDHTGGPVSAAGAVADNDLAVGKMVDTISHSPYWKDSAIFVVEDDSQAGSDHVDGHRAPVQVISPWAQHGAVDSRYYSQVTMVRTIEQILGVHPMNQMDSAASPMSGAFTGTPDYTPFNAVPNRTSLTLSLKTMPSCGADVPAPQNPAAAPAQTVATVPANLQNVAARWTQWQSQQHLTGPAAQPDYANNQQMNRFTWYQTHNWSTPYPGDSKILTPATCPAPTSGRRKPTDLTRAH